ncbi:Outer membrane vitamin B12 receptor BtuB [hydrothermal vent metagenome]|uniref:Outer membrane vitamin B12 receptor BtuB n=1 Tax=hydrothermal vent metagenome TaxID=652676 RepID=A0A3B0ZIJ1_9ZZZZ
MNNYLFIPAVIGLSYPLTGIADTKINEEPSDSSPIIVTASRTSETLDDTLASVSVITRDDIEKSSARSVADLLRLQAGIDISRTGGPAASTNVFLRGTNSNHTLFLVDGMRVSSATTGTFSFEQMNLSNIERIEIVRGPRASQYGSDAIGGIIQIFTRKNEGHHARIGVGSFGTKEASAGIRVGKEVTFRLNASHEEADGFSATNPDAGFFYNADLDAYKKSNVSADLAIPLGKSMNLSFKAWASDSEVEFDQGTTNGEQQDIVSKFDQQINNTWSQVLSVGYNNQKLETVSAFPSDISTKRKMIDWQNDFVLSDSFLLLVGLSRYEDQAKNINNSDQSVVFDEKIDNNGIFTNLSYRGSVHDFLFSLRGDDHSTFGSATTGLASWGMAISPSLRFTTSLSNGFRAPTINELFHPGFFFGFAGNPDLKPETSDGGELSLRWKSNNVGRLNVTYFHNNIDNLISYTGTNFQAENISSATTKGFEIEHSWQHAKWSVNTNATIQKAYDNDTREDLIRRPREKLTIATTHNYNQDVSASLEVIYSSERLDGFGSNKFDLPGYTLFNLSSRIKLDKHVWLDMRFDNITNKQYEFARGFNTTDRSFYFGVSYDLSK